MRRRSGSVLIAVLVGMAILEIVAVSLSMIATRTRVTSETEAAVAAARIGAESAIRTAVSEWDEARLGFPQVGARFSVPWAHDSAAGAYQSVEAERLFRGVYLLTSEGRTGAAGRTSARAVAAAIVTSIPSDELWLDFHSAIVTGSDMLLAAGARVDATDPATPPTPMLAVDCVNQGPPPPIPAGSARPALAFGGPSALSAAPGVAVTGAPPVLPFAARSTPSDFSRFGRLPLTDLSTIADHVVGGSVALAPRSIGSVCDTAATNNWGAPGNRFDPCFAWLPLVYSSTDLTVTSGDGQGILVVDGNLTLAAGVRFFGPVLVTGRVDTPGVELHGALRVGGPGSSIGGLVRFDECALTRAFTHGRALRRVYRVSDRWWLPPF